MKRYFTVLVLLALGSGLKAQDLTYGLEAGLNLSGGFAKEGPTVIKGNPGPGIALGGMADYKLPGSMPLSIRASLTFQYETATANVFGEACSFRISYLTLPIDVVYHSKLASGKLFFGLGPYFAYSPGGNYTEQGQRYKVVYGSNPDNDDAHRGDLGLDLMAGYQIQAGMFLTAKYDLGLIDVSADPGFYTLYVRSFGVNFLYMLPVKGKH